VFPDIFGGGGCEGENSHSCIWEFGKGDLRALRFCGVAVLQLERGKRLEAEGEMSNDKGERLRLRLRGGGGRRNTK